jgi:hypothetical protein
VLYLGRPVASVVIEAYRHLIDPVEVDDGAARESLIDNLVPRVLITCEVSVTQLLDLRTRGGASAGQPHNPGSALAYERPGRVRALPASSSHRSPTRAPRHHHSRGDQAGRDASLFTDLLPQEERARRIAADEAWDRLPLDPRLPGTPRLRVVRPTD